MADNMFKEENLEEISGGRTDSRRPVYFAGDFVEPEARLGDTVVVYEITEPGSQLSKGYRHSALYNYVSGEYFNYEKRYIENIHSGMKRCVKPRWIPK